MHTSPALLRQKVWDRAKSICVLCGVDCDEFEKSIRTIINRLNNREWDGDRRRRTFFDPLSIEKRIERILVKHGWNRSRNHFWEMDHIVPIVEGGDPIEMDNLRTLCVPCHKGETKQLHGRLAEARRNKNKIFKQRTFEFEVTNG